jgi:hypothetical protein
MRQPPKRPAPHRPTGILVFQNQFLQIERDEKFDFVPKAQNPTDINARRSIWRRRRFCFGHRSRSFYGRDSMLFPSAAASRQNVRNA